MNRKTTLLAFLGALFTFPLLGQFHLTGEFRPRFEYRHGFKQVRSVDSDPAAFISQRTRINLSYESASFNSKLVLQDVRTWGSRSQLSIADGLNSIHEAWALWKWKEGIGLKVGRQEVMYDDQRILGNVGWAQQARSHDLMKFQLEKKIKLHVGFAFNQNKEQVNTNLYTVGGSYKTLQYIWFNKSFGKVKLSLLGLNKGDQYIEYNLQNEVVSQETRYNQLAGTHIKILGNKMQCFVSAYWQGGEHVSGKKLNAFQNSIDLNYKADQQFSLQLGYELLSGTDQDNTTDLNSFTPLFGTNHKFNGFMDYFYVGNHINNVGLIDLHAGGKMKLGDKSSLMVKILNFYSHAKILHPLDNSEMEAGLGTEVDLAYSIKPKEGVALKVGASILSSSETMRALKGGVNMGNLEANKLNSWAWVMLTFKPRYL